MMITQSTYPPGFRFSPSDYELVSHYLTNFLVNPEKDLDPSLSHLIKKYDIYTLEPCNLPLKSDSHLMANETYFFTQRRKLSKSIKGILPKRMVEVEGDDNNPNEIRGGFWRSLIARKPICDKKIGANVGFLNTLYFNRKVANKRRKEEVEKTHWLMDEYEINVPNFQEWVLCRIKFMGNPNYDVPYGHYKVVPEQDNRVVSDQPTHDNNVNNSED
ncbi:hypothetical protein ACFE04_026587 [Oxalis oulophora]